MRVKRGGGGRGEGLVGHLDPNSVGPYGAHHTSEMHVNVPDRSGGEGRGQFTKLGLALKFTV